MLKNPNYVYGAEDTSVSVKINFGDFMLRKLLEHDDKVAVVNASTDESLTYRQIAQDAMNLAVSLTRIGVRKGDVIALITENRFEFFSTLIGVACTGAVVCHTNPNYSKGEMKHIMNISKPQYIFCSPTTYENHKSSFKSLSHVKTIVLFGNVEENNTLSYNGLITATKNNWLLKNVSFEEFNPVDVQGQIDTLFVLYSSGTTGLPKGVMLTHLNIISMCNIFELVIKEENAVHLNITPWYHAMGLTVSLSSLAKGKKMVYLPKYQLKLYLETIEKYKITQLIVVPPILISICKTEIKNDVSSVRIIYSGAAALHKDTLANIQSKFPNLVEVFQNLGSSEALPITTDSGDFRKADTGCVGFVNRNTVMKIVDIDNRKALGPNQRGEICIKGVMLMKGYINKDRREDFDEEGFFKTGDIAYYDDRKCFFVVDRLKEIIKYKGFQVPPVEIEAVLLQHEAVRDVGVVGIPHQEGGEVPMAFVVTQPGMTVPEKELKEFVSTRLSNPKHLRGGVRFVSEIPKNASGKILRRELRKMAKSSNSKP